MTVFKHEIKQVRITLLIWGSVVGLMILICMLTYPGMDENASNTFENMGALSDAFGMSQLSISSLMGLYGLECGNVLAIGGAFFAALIGIGMLSKEESEHTAEFLLTHPISRKRIVIEKLFATFFIIVLFNVLCLIFSIASFVLIGELENMVWNTFWLFHLAQFVMQIEIALVCFSISAFMKRGGLGIGIGFAALMYFLNIVCNISAEAEFLKYITPYQYAEPSLIFSEASIDGIFMTSGIAYAVIGIIVAIWHYSHKDIVS